MIDELLEIANNPHVGDAVRQASDTLTVTVLDPTGSFASCEVQFTKAAETYSVSRKGWALLCEKPGTELVHMAPRSTL